MWIFLCGLERGLHYREADTPDRQEGDDTSLLLTSRKDAVCGRPQLEITIRDLKDFVLSDAAFRFAGA